MFVTKKSSNTETEKKNKKNLWESLRELVEIKSENRQWKTRNFDESKFSEVVLIVKGERFHVSKLYLASHSAYFEALFMGNFEEAKKSEIELNDIDPKSFQHFIESIHGETEVKDETLNELLHLSDFFDSKAVFRRCEEFLLSNSRLSSEEKFRVAVRYKMSNLIEKCMCEMKTNDDIRRGVLSIVDDSASPVWKMLLIKSLSFERI
uniref:BTB domain-containing protein n=2 Tax=Caenorhabditis tropicalis TaxID=1561998 RepID=A0A1I7UGM4_9PELO